ncbi:MAG: MFS transporter [Actinobacteria bacterium]|nr:MFS transporter [Actinomycetota bacterium]
MDRKFLLILGLAGFTVMADNWVVSPILPAISGSFNVPAVRAGVLITAYMIPFGLFQLVFGPLADRFGKRQVINTAMIFFAGATALCAIAGGLTDLTVYRALTGIFAASVMPIGLALIGDLVPMQERQSAIGTFMGISFLGQGLSMFIGGTIAYLLSWRGVFAAYAVLAVISAATLFYAGRAIPSRKNPESKFIAPYIRLISQWYSLKTYLIVIVEGIFIIGTFSYLGAYIKETYHYNFLYIGLIMTGFGLTALIGGRLSGKLAARLGRRGVLTMGLTSAFLADLLLYSNGSNLGLLILSVCLLGLGFMLAHSTLLTIATGFAAQARGAVMSAVAFCFMGGGGIGTAIGGQYIQKVGFSQFFMSYCLGLLVLLVAAYLLMGKEKETSANS